MSNPTGKLRACVRVLHQRQMRRLVLAFFAFMLIETITWTGSLVYAYQQGGAREVGLAAFGLLAPAVLIAPIASFCGDRFPRVHVLGVSYLLIGMCSAAVAVTINVGAISIVVYIAASATAATVTFPRPAMGALLPCTAATTDELTAANVCVGVAQSVGIAIGPAIAGVLLATSSVDSLFAVSAVLGIVAGGLVISVCQVIHEAPAERVTLGDVHGETLAGLRLLRAQRRPRLVVGLMGLNASMIGVLDVCSVVIAIDLLGRDDGFAGALASAQGVGAIIGASFGVLLVGRRRLAPLMMIAASVQCLPLVGFTAPPSATMALVIFVLCGAGVSMSDLCGLTMLQGITPDDVMARVFGCLEGFRMASIAIGSIVCSTLVDQFGIRSGLSIMAFSIAVLVWLSAPGLLAIDRARPAPDEDLLALLRATTIFAPLPAYALEQLMINMRPVEPVVGEIVIEEQARGSTMFLVAAGELIVSRDGIEVARCRRGDYFGEVALLFDQPRNATVVADRDVVLYELDRDVFLEAVTGHPRSWQRTNATADQRAPNFSPER